MYVTPLDGKRWISGIKTTDAKKMPAHILASSESRP